MSMRALVIAPQPFFSARGTPLSVYYRTLVMAELCVQVDFITYGEGQDVDIPGLRIIRIPRFKWLGNVKVGPSYLKLFLDVFLTLRVVAQLCIRRYDFVHAHEEAIFICRFLKPLFRFKLVYDMHSNLAQQLTNTRFTRSRILKRLFRRLQDSCIRTSEVVITICPDLADYVTAIPQRAGSHILIENSIFDPVRLAQPASQGAPAVDQQRSDPGVCRQTPGSSCMRGHWNRTRVSSCCCRPSAWCCDPSLMPFCSWWAALPSRSGITRILRGRWVLTAGSG